MTVASDDDGALDFDQADDMIAALAAEVVDRLNALLSDAAVRALLQAAVLGRHPIDRALAERHPTIQAEVVDPDRGRYGVGLLGILNGMLGTVSTGPNRGAGLICAVFDRGALREFALTPDDQPIAAHKGRILVG